MFPHSNAAWLGNADAYYGEGLFDADLAWTMDFMSNDTGLLDGLGDLLSPPLLDLTPGVIAAPLVNHSDSSQAEDEDPRDWPDRESRPASPTRRTFQTQKRGPHPICFQTDETERRHFMTNHPAKVGNISPDTRFILLQILGSPNMNAFCGPPPTNELFPGINDLDYFIQLYFVHVQPYFPVIHMPTFSISAAKPLLLLSMMLLGSSHSASNRGRFGFACLERTRLALMHERELDIKFVSVPTDHTIIHH